MIKIDSKGLGYLKMGPGRFETDRENDHIKLFGNHLSFLGLIVDIEIVAVRVLYQMGDARTDVTNFVLLFCPVDILVEVLPIGSHVHEEDGGFEFRPMFLSDDRFFGRVHAADRGTVSSPDVGIP